MRILHLTTLFPYSEEHLQNGAGGHAVYHLIDNIRKEMGKDSQLVCFYSPILAPYYEYFSKSKPYSKYIRGNSWYPNLYSRSMLTLPYGILKNWLSYLWQKSVSLQFLGNLSYDIIHLHSSFTLGILSARIKKRSAKKMVITTRREFHKDHWAKLCRTGKKSVETAVRSADAVVSPSAISAFEIQRTYVKPVRIIPNGTSEVFNRYDKNKKRDQKTILFVGRLDENKNIKKVIDVFNNIHKKDPEAKLKIIGDGPLQAMVLKTIEGNRNIDYLGWQPQEQVREEMRKSTILCVPSFTETFGIVYAEAMKQGMAVVGRSGTGIDGHGIRGKHYALIDNDEDLEDVLMSLLYNKEKREELCRNGRMLARNWDWKQAAKHYLKIYEECENSIQKK